MKKGIIIKLVLLLVLTSLTACTKKEEVSNGDHESANTDGVPLEVSISLMGGPKTPDSWVEHALEKDLSDHLERPVDMKNIYLPGWSDAKTKINLLMSDKSSMPDVTWFWDMEEEYQTWIEAGVLIDWVPYLQKYGQNIIRYYSKDTLFYSWQDGKMYRIPGDVAEPATMTTTIRKDWLEHLNLEVPTTLKEYIEVIKAFTFDDPDGNGKDDTYGFTGEHQWRAFAPFFYSHGVDVEQFMIQPDGTLKFGATMPQVKDVLKILQDLYAQGVIDPRIMNEHNNIDDIYAEGKAGSLYFWVAYFNPGSPHHQSFKSLNPDGEYMAIEPIKGPNGFSSDVASSGTGWCFLSVTTEAEEPSAVVKVLDRIASPEIYKLTTFGKKGEHYTIENGQYKPLVTPEEADQIGLETYQWVLDRKDEANIRNTQEVIDLFKKRETTSKPMKDKIVYFKSNNRPAWKEYSADLKKLRDETFYGIISGNLDISAFDEFVDKFYQIGGKEVEAEANEMFEAQKEERKEYNRWYEKHIEPYK